MSRPLSEEEKAQFAVLTEAVQQGCISLVLCKRVSDGELVPVVCLTRVGESVDMLPLAVLAPSEETFNQYDPFWEGKCLS